MQKILQISQIINTVNLSHFPLVIAFASFECFETHRVSKVLKKEKRKRKLRNLSWNDAKIQGGCAKYQEIIDFFLSRVLTLQTSRSTKCALLLELTFKPLLTLINWPQKSHLKRDSTIHLITSYNTWKIESQSSKSPEQLDFSDPYIYARENCACIIK